MYKERKDGARPYFEGLLNASLQSMDVILNQNNITFRRKTSDDGSNDHDKVSIMASPCVNYLTIKSPMTWAPWVTSILRMRELRLEEMKHLFQGHLASKWKSRHLHPCLFDHKAMLFIISLHNLSGCHWWGHPIPLSEQVTRWDPWFRNKTELHWPIQGSLENSKKLWGSKLLVSRQWIQKK